MITTDFIHLLTLILQSSAANAINHEREMKRIKQEEYAKELEKQITSNLGAERITDKGAKPPSFEQSQAESFQIGSQLDKDAKRKRQTEYANALQRDQQNLHAIQLQVKLIIVSWKFNLLFDLSFVCRLLHGLPPH